ncbi:MAG: hypothetical protein KDA89_11830 [Planctomycetaceae bacterium]|nr:hypothetical protein [Planctomycetaceae bacterium]
MADFQGQADQGAICLGLRFDHLDGGTQAGRGNLQLFAVATGFLPYFIPEVQLRGRKTRNRFGRPPGVPGRGEFGIEVIVAPAYQVYCVGLSIDKACAVLSFFQQLKLRKSQADALLNQLARTWEQEFDTLYTLLANSAVVHAGCQR